MAKCRLVDIKQGLDRAVKCIIIARPLAPPTGICYNALLALLFIIHCFLTVLFHKTILLLSFDSLFELTIIVSLLLCMYFKYYSRLLFAYVYFITIKNVL